MKTTGTSDYQYTTEGGTPKLVNTLASVICAPDLDAPKEEREQFVKILEHYYGKME